MSLREFVERFVLTAAATPTTPPIAGVSTIYANESLAEERLNFPRAFKLVPPIYGCVSRIQSSLASYPITFRDAAGKIIEPAMTNDGPNVAWLFAYANSRDTGHDLFEQIVGSLLLAGNAYVHLDPMGTKRPRALFCLPPHLITPRSSDGVIADRYVLMSPDGREFVLPATNILHIRMYDPDHGLTGLSPLQVAMLAAATHRDANRWLAKVFKSGGLVSGYMTHEDSMVPNERARVQQDILAQRDAGLPLILPRKLQYQRTGLTVGELQFLETASLTKDDIFMIYRMPPVIMGTKDGGGLSDAGASTDLLLYYEMCLKPLARKVVATIRERILNEPFHQAWAGFGLTAEINMDGALPVQLAMLRKAKAMNEAAGRPVMPLAEVREAGGLSNEKLHPEDQEDAQRLYVPRAASPFEGKDDGEDEREDREAARRGGTPRRATATEGRPARASNAMDDRSMLRARNDARLSGQEKHIRTGVRRVLAQQERRVVAAIKQGIEARAAAHTANGTHLPAASMHAALDLDHLLEATPADRALIRRFMARVVSSTGNRELQDLGLRVTFRMGAENVERFLDSRSKVMIEGTTRTTAGQLRDSLAEGVKANETHAELVARVRETFRDRYAHQADTIVRTETVAGYNFASQEAWVQSDVVEAKEWVTAGDELVRGNDERDQFDHVSADGQVVDLDELFEVSGERLAHPGDHAHGASAGNTINCRCTAAPIRKRAGSDDEESARAPGGGIISVEELLAR